MRPNPRMRPLVCLIASLVLVGACAQAGATPPPPSASATGSSSPSPSAPPPPTAVPVPSPTGTIAPLTDIAWRRTGTMPAERDRLLDLVGFDDGYVAIQGDSRAVWFSADARTWSKLALPFEVVLDEYGQTLTASVTAVATDGDRVLVVGGYEHEPCADPNPPTTGGGPRCTISPISWVSDDGRTWVRNDPTAMPAVEPATPQGGELVRAWAVPGAGWDAAVGAWTGESRIGRALWHSRDGLTWTVLGDAPAGASEDGGWPFPRDGAANQAGERVLWQRAMADERMAATLHTSPDGVTWTPVPGFDGAGTELLDAIPTDADGGWLVGGRTGGGDEEPWSPVLWSGRLVEGCCAIGLPVDEPDHWPTSLVATSFGYLAIGGARSDQASASWASADGVSWSQLPPPEPGGERPVDPDSGEQVPTELWFAADGPAGVIGLGIAAGNPTATTVWALR